MSSFAFFWIVLYISAHSILFIALATLDVLCWINSLLVSLMVSTSSSSCSVSYRFLNSSLTLFVSSLVLVSSWS